MLYTFLVVIDTLLAIAVVVLVLLNRGQGAEVGAVFGGSSPSSSVFGSKGSTPFITKVIAVLVGLFLLNSLGLAYLANSQYIESSVIDDLGIEKLRLDQDPADGTQDVPMYGDESAGAGGNTGNGAVGTPSDIPN